MRVLITLIIFSSISFADDSSKICNEIVKLASNKIVKDLDAISSFFERKLGGSCNSSPSLEDELVDSIITEDKEKFNRILKKLENSYIFKLLKKISKKEDLEKKFKAFLNDKFDTLTSRMTSNEKAILKEDPLKTLYVFFQYSQALDYMKKHDPEVYKSINKPYGKADAMRHMFINASASRFGMSSFVKKLSTQRELSGGYIEYSEEAWRSFQESDYNKFNEHKFSDLIKCNPNIDREKVEQYAHEYMLDKMIVNRMDIHNNAIGIKIGENSPCMSMESIYKQVQLKYKESKAREIVSSGARCFDVSSNYDDLVATNDERDCLHTNALELKLSHPKIKDGKLICK